MPAWIHSDPNADDGHWNNHGLRECARAAHCSDPRLETAGGKTVRLPALTPRPFCEADRAAVAKALGDLPLLFVRVHQRLDKSFAVAGGPAVSTSKTPPVPVNLAADELARLILAVLVSWEERVRAVARLSPVDTETSVRRRDGAVLTQAWTILAAHLDALLALPREPMMRSVPLHQAATLPPGTTGLVHRTAGYADVVVPLSGADAGLEILHLHHRCRMLLTDTRPPARHLPTPCGWCGFCELRELLDDGQPAGATCRQCGTEYDAQQYSDLAKEESDTVKRAGARRRRTVQVGAHDDPEVRRA